MFEGFRQRPNPEAGGAGDPPLQASPRQPGPRQATQPRPNNYKEGEKWWLQFFVAYSIGCCYQPEINEDYMPFPSTRAELEASGYRIANYGKCKGCQEPIEWWLTPSGQRMPMNDMPDLSSAATAHFSTCPKADQFRKPPHGTKQCDLFSKS